MAIPMGILAAPLMLFHIVNLFELPEMKLGIFTFPRMEVNRAKDFVGITWGQFTHVLYNIFMGDDYFRFDSTAKYKTLYVVTIFFFVAGFFSVLKRLAKGIRARKFDAAAFVFLWFWAVLLINSSLFVSHTYKLNAIFLSTVLISVEGVRAVCGLCVKAAVRIVRGPEFGCKAVFAAAAVAIYVINFSSFFIYYYGGQYTQDYYPLEMSGTDMSEGIRYVEEHSELRDNRRMTYTAEWPIFYAFSARLSPWEFYAVVLENAAEMYSGLIGTRYYCGSLPDIEDDCNYLVTDIFWEYAQELRDNGFTEIKYDNYSLFFKE